MACYAVRLLMRVVVCGGMLCYNSHMKNIAIACVAAALSATAAAGDPYDYKELVAREVEPAGAATNAAGRMVVDFGMKASDILAMSHGFPVAGRSLERCPSLRGVDFRQSYLV